MVSKLNTAGRTKDRSRELFGVVLKDKTGAIRPDQPWTFGRPTLQAQGNGRSYWSRGTAVLSTHQKGSTGWVAELIGGVQTAWDDAAEMYLPVNEMPLLDLQVGTTMWSWFQAATQLSGVGMVIWVHDPADFDKRAEITMLAETGHMELGAGWNAHELADGNDCIWYGENTGTHSVTATQGAPYDFSKFLADDVFSKYTIYRLSWAHGFQTGGSDYKAAYLADVKINGIQIPLYPDVQRFRKTVNTQKTLDANGAYTAEDVMSESPTNTVGTDWDFNFGASGKIVQAVIASETTGLTAEVDLYLFSRPPTSQPESGTPHLLSLA